MARCNPRIVLLALACSACVDTINPEEVNENEVITTVVLSFVPQSGGATLEFRWADPEYDGDPEIDDIVLSSTDDYDLSVSFLNELEDPAEDISGEILAEADEHQVFFTGSSLEAPEVVAVEAVDTDGGGYPLGLQNTLHTRSTGTGSFVVTLRHLPPENGTPVKTAELAEALVAEGFGALPGATDAQVFFELSVQ